MERDDNSLREPARRSFVPELAWSITNEIPKACFLPSSSPTNLQTLSVALPRLDSSTYSWAKIDLPVSMTGLSSARKASALSAQGNSASVFPTTS